MIRAERAALADELAGLSDEQWAQPSLCGEWTVEEVVAHLTAGASNSRIRWLGSVVRARFDFEAHNARQLTECRGATPAETLRRFRAIIDSTVAPSGQTAAWLGEVVVHGQDIRYVLGLPGKPAIEAVTAVAEFFASRDYAVASRSAIAGLRVEASDGSFATGGGPLVGGITVALVMAMAGRSVYCDELTGPGVPILRGRL